MARSNRFETIRPTEGGASGVKTSHIAPFGAKKDPSTGEVTAYIRGPVCHFERTFLRDELLAYADQLSQPRFALINAIGDLGRREQKHKEEALRLLDLPQRTLEEEAELQKHVYRALLCEALIAVTRDGGGCYDRFYSKPMENWIRNGDRRSVIGEEAFAENND